MHIEPNYKGEKLAGMPSCKTTCAFVQYSKLALFEQFSVFQNCKNGHSGRFKSMSVAEFSAYSAKSFEEDVVEVVKRNKISGSTFLKLSERQMENMIPAIGEVVKLMDLQAAANKSERVRKFYIITFFVQNILCIVGYKYYNYLKNSLVTLLVRRY